MGDITPDANSHERYTDRSVVSRRCSNVTYDKLQDLFTTFRQVEDITTVADGRQLASHSQGTICIQFEGEWVQVH